MEFRCTILYMTDRLTANAIDFIVEDALTTFPPLFDTQSDLFHMQVIPLDIMRMV